MAAPSLLRVPCATTLRLSRCAISSPRRYCAACRLFIGNPLVGNLTFPHRERLYTLILPYRRVLVNTNFQHVLRIYTPICYTTGMERRDPTMSTDLMTIGD